MDHVERNAKEQAWFDFRQAVGDWCRKILHAEELPTEYADEMADYIVMEAETQRDEIAKQVIEKDVGEARDYPGAK